MYAIRSYYAYDEAIDAVPRYTNSQIINSLKAGEFVFTANHNKAIVEQDINTLTTFTLTKGSAFSKNRVVRVLDEINNDFVDLFSSFYLGKVSNNAESRNLLKNECINYLEALQKKEAIKDFDSKTDISVQEGTSGDSVLIETYVITSYSIHYTKLYDICFSCTASFIIVPPAGIIISPPYLKPRISDLPVP